MPPLWVGDLHSMIGFRIPMLITCMVMESLSHYCGSCGESTPLYRYIYTFKQRQGGKAGYRTLRLHQNSLLSKQAPNVTSLTKYLEEEA